MELPGILNAVLLRLEIWGQGGVQRVERARTNSARSRRQALTIRLRLGRVARPLAVVAVLGEVPQWGWKRAPISHITFTL